MLYLIISTPRPSKPEDVKNVRLEFRSWINDLKSKKTLFAFTPEQAEVLLSFSMCLQMTNSINC